MNENEEKLIRIQKSTRTSLPFFVPIHNFLRMRLKWYYNWHLWKHSSRTHVAVLAAAVLGIIGGMWCSVNSVVHPEPIAAAGESWVVSGAGDVDMNGTYEYFGTCGGKDNYRLGSTSNYLFWCSGASKWLLSDTTSCGCPPAPASFNYWGDGASPDLPANTWTVGSEGIAGAPTVTAGSVTVPDPPTIGTATGGNAQASVTFTPPSNDGGSVITGYTVTSTPSSITGTGVSSPIVVSGLTNGTSYTFTVHATNAVGNSTESAASNAVVPAASGVTVSGTVYSDIQKSSNIGVGKTIALSINGAVATTAETASDGSYSFSGVTIPENAVVAMFISGETEKGSIIIQTGTVVTTYTDLEWYKDNVKPSFRVGTDVTEITNVALDTADNVGDSDLGVTVSGSTATFASNMILYVWNGKTYRPNGNVVAGDIVIHGTLNAESNNVTVSGDFIKGGNYYYSTGGVDLIGDGVVQGVNGYSLSFYNLSMAAASKTTQMLSSVDVTNVLTLGTGNLTGESDASVWFSRNDGLSPLVNNGATIHIHRFFFSPYSGSITVPAGNYGTVEYLELYSRGANVTYNVSGNITVNGIFFIVGYNTTSGMVVNTNNYTINANGMIWGYSNAYGNTTTNFGSSVVNLGSYGIAPLPAPGGSHVVNFNSATLNVGGSFDLLGITPNFGTSVLNMTATTSGKNIKTYGQNLSNGVTFNGVGGEWTLQDTLTVSGLTITNGKLIDNGQTVNVGGSIIIASTAYNEIYRLESTGVWNMTASGDISNNGWYSGGPINSIYDFRIAEGVTARRINDFNIRNLTFGNNAVISRASNPSPLALSLRIWHPWQDGFISASGTYTISGSRTTIFLTENDVRVQGVLNWGEGIVLGSSTNLNYAGGILKAGGDWNISDGLTVYGTDFLSPYILDMNGQNLTLSGDLSVGYTDRASVNDNLGVFKFSTGTHTINGDLSVPNRSSSSGDTSAYSHGSIDFGSSNVSIGGDIALNSPCAMTVPGTGTVNLVATSTEKTVTSGGQTLPSLVFDGVGGEWTLQDDLTATGLTVTNGTFIDNAKTVTVNGTIDISRGSNSVQALNSTGTWLQGASGNIRNCGGDGNTLYYQDNFNKLVLSSGVASNRSGHVYTKELVLDDNAILSGDGWLMFAFPVISDPITIGSNANITGSTTRFYPTQGVTYTQKTMSISDDFAINHSTAGVIKMTGNWSVGSLNVYGNTSTDTEAEANVLDTNGYNLTVNGNLLMGSVNNSYQDQYHGKIVFSSGSHIVTGNISVAKSTTKYSRGYFDFGSSHISVGGNLTLDSHAEIVGDNTSTIILNGSVAQTVTSDSSFNNLSVANTSVQGVSLVGDVRVNDTFTDTTASSKITFGSGQSYNFANININGGSLSTPIILASSIPGTQWNFNVSNSWPTVSYVSASDSNASGGSQIRATDGTSRDGGNNLNWLFSRAISRVTLTPSVLNINSQATAQFAAKVYNVWGEEVIGAVTWSVDPSAGTISNSGLFAASSNIGNFDNAVTATIDGISGSADVNILAVQPYIVPGWIIISPDSKVLKPEEEYQFSGKVYDTTGVEITNAEPTWELVSGGGDISESGFFKAGKEDGVFVNSVVAKYSDVRSYATVVVRDDQVINPEGKEKTFISVIVSAGRATLDIVKAIAKNDPAKEVALAITVVATASAGISGLFGLASAQMGLKEWLYFIVNYFLSLRAARRKNKFGMVFDESSQRPVAGAMISLFDFKTMRLVSTAITDKNGAYIFLVQPGEYVMSVIKPGFIFPSNMIKMSQNLVNNYIGQTLAVTNENPVVNQNIPIDPSSDQKIKIGLFYRLMNSIYFRPAILLIGSSMTVYSLLIQPKLLNYIIAAGFVLLWLAELFIQNRNVRFCKVVDNITRKPVSLALVRVLSPENKLIETFISDQYGRVLPKVSNIGDTIIVEKSGYSQISQVVSSQGLVERKQFGLIKGDI